MLYHRQYCGCDTTVTQMLSHTNHHKSTIFSYSPNKFADIIGIKHGTVYLQRKDNAPQHTTGIKWTNNI